MSRYYAAPYNNSYIDFDFPFWNPQQVLKAGPGRCSGITLKGLPCGQRMFSGSDIRTAEELLEDLSYLDPRQGIPKQDLELLAELTLCPRWHRDKRPQGPSVVSRWRSAVQAHAQCMPPLRRSRNAVERRDRADHHSSSTTRNERDSRTQTTSSRAQHPHTQSTRHSTNRSPSISRSRSRHRRSPSLEPEEPRRRHRGSSIPRRETNVSDARSPSRPPRSRTSNQSSARQRSSSRPRQSSPRRHDAPPTTSRSVPSSHVASTTQGRSNRRRTRTVLSLTVTQDTYSDVDDAEESDSSIDQSDDEPNGSDHDHSDASDSHSDTGSDSDHQIFTPSPTTATPSTSRTASPAPSTPPHDPHAAICPICHDPLTDGPPSDTPTTGNNNTDIVHCRAQCGQNFHAACMREWSEHQQRAAAAAAADTAAHAREAVTCPYCRVRWQWSEDGGI